MHKIFFVCLLGLGICACEPLPMRITNNADRHNWAEINLEREKAGLKPLTWEQYHDPAHNPAP